MLKFSSLGYEVAGRSIFHGLSGSFDGRKHGLVGHNGVGKTTFARLLAGELAPALGHVARDGAVYFLAQFETPPAQTVAEYLADLWQSPGARLLAELTAPLEFSRRLDQLSGGEWMRARLARAVISGASFLILDEPTNNLDAAGRAAVRDLVRGYPGGILVISHDRDLLSEVDEIVEMSARGLAKYGGAMDFYLEQRAMERARHADEVERLKRGADRSREERAAKLASQEKRMREGARKALSAGLPKIILGGLKRQAQKSHAKLKRREDRIVGEASLQAHEALAASKQDPFIRLDFEGAASPTGRTLLEVDGLNWNYPGGPMLWKEPLKFRIQGGQRWSLTGPNGVGKTTLFKILLSAEGGQRWNTRRIGYLDQNYGLLDPHGSLLSGLRAHSRFDEVELRNELAFYGFTGEKVFQRVETLSGGERLRAGLARIFLAEEIPEIILLDEPTNNLDLGSLGLLERALLAFQGALLVSSHDARFLRSLRLTHQLELMA